MDISYREVEGICENAPLTIIEPSVKPDSRSPVHPIEAHTALCSFVDAYMSSRWILEERGYNGSGPNIPREAAAFYLRFISFLHTYNNFLRAHPQAPPELKNDLFLSKKYNAEDYELYRDFFNRTFLYQNVPEVVFEEWTSWD